MKSADVLKQDFAFTKKIQYSICIHFLLEVCLSESVYSSHADLFLYRPLRPKVSFRSMLCQLYFFNSFSVSVDIIF